MKAKTPDLTDFDHSVLSAIDQLNKKKYIASVCNIRFEIFGSLRGCGSRNIAIEQKKKVRSSIKKMDKHQMINTTTPPSKSVGKYIYKRNNIN